MRDSDAPYLLDLQLFLGKRLILGREGGERPNFTEDVIIGGLVRDKVASSSEWVTKLLEEDIDLFSLKGVAVKGEKLYLRTRNSASSESAKRSKGIISTLRWNELHPLFNNDTDVAEMEREKMLARVSGFRPQETVFEMGKRGSQGQAGEIVKKRRETIEARRKKLEEAAYHSGDSESDEDEVSSTKPSPKATSNRLDDADMESASEEELEITFSEQPSSKRPKTSRDESVYMSYTPTTVNTHEDRAYGVQSGSYQLPSFVKDARSATMDLANDEGNKSFGEPSRGGMRWDKKNKKYVARANDDDGSKGPRMIKSESGGKIAASFRSGRFDAWKKSNRITRLPRVGEAESRSHIGRGGAEGGKRWKHKAEKAPKAADKARDDYHVQKKKVEAAKEKRVGRFRDGEGKSEIKGAREVQKERAVVAKKKEKTGRPTKRR